MPVLAYAGANVSNGNAVTTVFPYNFKILDQTHIEVKVDGVLKVLGADYTVSGVGLSGGGNVTMTAAPANNAVVQRARKVPYTRVQGYQNNGDFKELTVDNDLDTIEMQVQQAVADAARAFKAPLSVTADQVLTDAAWTGRASKWMGFDALGNFILGAGAVGVPVETVVQIVGTVAQLKAVAAPGAAVAYLVLGFAAAGDGGGGFFWWNAADVAADNGGTILQLTAGGAGRFNRLF